MHLIGLMQNPSVMYKHEFTTRSRIHFTDIVILILFILRPFANHLLNPNYVLYMYKFELMSIVNLKLTS